MTEIVSDFDPALSATGSRHSGHRRTADSKGNEDPAQLAGGAERNWFGSENSVRVLSSRKCDPL